MKPLLSPFPYQARGADWLALHPKVFLADVMGLGKSGQAVIASDIVGARNILVICPANVRCNWEREFERFSPLDRPCRLVVSGSTPLPASGVVVISYDLALARAKELRAKTWDVLILDEAHFLKERDSKRTKAIYGHGKRQVGIAANVKYVWPLSGTPAPNDASELWTHLHFAGITQLDYWDYVFRYCTGFNTDYDYKVTGHQNVQELKALIKPFFLRRTKHDVELDLPDLYYQTVTIERSDAETALDATFNANDLSASDRSLRAALWACVNDEARIKALESQAPALATLRRYIGLAKVPAICDLLAEELTLNPTLRLCLFAQHTGVVEATLERLSAFGAVGLYGKTAQAQRQAHIDAFANDPSCRVFVGNIQAAGVGIDGLQRSCSEVVFLEQDWVPSNNAQAVARISRIGQKMSVRVRIFSLYGSVDEEVQDALTRKSIELTKIDF